MSLLPEVREELVATAARIAESPRRRMRFAWRGGMAMALGVGVALAVVAVGVLALRHRAPAPASTGPPAGSGLAALEAKLAVLRRPQTSGERAYAKRFPAHGVVIARLVRLATTVGQLRVYVLVARMPNRAAPFVVARAVDREGQWQGGTGRVSAPTLTPGAVGAGAVIRGLGPDPNQGMSVGVVPDGVVRVEWVFTGAAFGVLKPRPVTVYPAVKNNVAVARVIPDQGPLARAVWYGARGQVIASTGGGPDAKAQLRQIQLVNASRNRAIAPELIAHYRLFRSVAPVDLTRSPALPTAGGGPGDLNYWQTRYIGSLTGLDGPGLWITPGTRDVCISDWNAGSCTAPLSRREDAGIPGGITGGGGETTFVGLVPDGNSSVTVVMANGDRKTFPVIENAYEFTVRGRVVAMINRGIHGRVVRRPIGG